MFVSMDSYELGAAIRLARTSRGMGVREAAKAAGISQAWWRTVEQGYERRDGVDHPVRVKPERVARMCLAVGLPPGAFLHGEGVSDQAPTVGGYTAGTTAGLDTDGLSPDEMLRAQAFIDGMRAGRAPRKA